MSVNMFYDKIRQVSKPLQAFIATGITWAVSLVVLFTPAWFKSRDVYFGLIGSNKFQVNLTKDHVLEIGGRDDYVIAVVRALLSSASLSILISLFAVCFAHECKRNIFFAVSACIDGIAGILLMTSLVLITDEISCISITVMQLSYSYTFYLCWCLIPCLIISSILSVQAHHKAVLVTHLKGLV